MSSSPTDPSAPPPFLAGLRAALVLPVIVGALGYFVDIYDLILFSILRVRSLQSLGLSPEEVTKQGAWLLNLQMIGMLLGGVLWGVLGDKRGRVALLFGSIIMYSAANIANGFVQSIEAYEFWRFVAGVGLAGELGGCITLVSEVLPKHVRGYGTTIIATVGVFGAVAAGITAKYFDWRTCYFIGGGLGFALLVLRLGVLESGMFEKIRHGGGSRGDFFSLFTDRSRFRRYACCILIGLPTWFVVGVLVTLSPEFARAIGVQGPVNAGDAVMICYLGITAGDFASGSLSQLLRSRRKVVAIFLLLSAVGIALYFLSHGVSARTFYTFIFVIGLGMGYWAVFVTVGAEQFGTNIRATVATTVPNFARGSLPLISAAFFALQEKAGLKFTTSAIVVGLACFLIAFAALAKLEETYDKNLDFVE